MELLEYHKFKEVSPKLFEPNIKEISEVDFNRKVKQLEVMEIMGINIGHKDSPRLWMKKFCKYYRKNGKNQGYIHTDWDKIQVDKRR